MIAAPWTMRQSVRGAILTHAREESPRECCGLLLGDRRHLAFALRMTNIARGTKRFRMSDRDHVDVRRVLRRMHPALSVIGAYHSHPAGVPWPSDTDIEQAHYPRWIHLIVGLAPRAALRGFLIERGSVERIRLRLISSRAGSP